MDCFQKIVGFKQPHGFQNLGEAQQHDVPRQPVKSGEGRWHLPPRTRRCLPGQDPVAVPGPGPAAGPGPSLSSSPAALRLPRRRPPAPAARGRPKGDARCSPEGGTATGSPPSPGGGGRSPPPPPSRRRYRALGTSTGPSTPPPAKACPLYFSSMPGRGSGRGPTPLRGERCEGRGASAQARRGPPPPQRRHLILRGR